MCRPRPTQPAAAPASIAQRLAWLRTPAIAHALLVTWLTFTGAFCVYTYLAPLTHAIAGPLLTDHLPLVLAAFAAAAIAGSLTGGHLADCFGARFSHPTRLAPASRTHRRLQPAGRTVAKKAACAFPGN